MHWRLLDLMNTTSNYDYDFLVRPVRDRSSQNRRLSQSPSHDFGKSSKIVVGSNIVAVQIMHRTYKPLFWRATRPVNSPECMIEGRNCLKRIIIDIFILYFIKYFHSFTQSVVFTGRVARQNNGLYVLRMIVKLVYCWESRSHYYEFKS